jgi:hypothetical protein
VHVKWRVVALGALLGMAVVAGAFLLPDSSKSDRSELAAAVRRTLDATSFRSTTRVSGEAVLREEFVAPDQLRVVTRLQGQQFETVVVGDEMYVTPLCADPSAPFVKRPNTGPVRSSTFGMLTAIADARDDSTVRLRDGRTVHTLALEPDAFGSDVPSPPAIKPVAIKARVAVDGGYVVGMTLGLRFTDGHRSATQKRRTSFSNYGTVSPIKPPQSSRISDEADALTCDLDSFERAGGGTGHG